MIRKKERLVLPILGNILSSIQLSNHSKLNSKETKDDFKIAFEIIDTDKDKLISFNDLKSFLENAGEKRTDE